MYLARRTSSASDPSRLLKDAAGAIKAVPYFEKELRPAIENLTKVTKRLLNVAPTNYDSQPLDRALVALNDKVLYPVAEHRGKAEIAITDVMRDRFHSLARNLSETSTTFQPPPTSLFGKAAPASFASVIGGLSESINTAIEIFFAEGGFSLDIIQERPRRYLLTEVSNSPNLGPSSYVQAAQEEISDSSESFVPSLASILDICPKFRILVIGKTGVGKSSLIQHAFGVERDLASHYAAGKATLDYEFTSPINKYFILHDSQGFEPGDLTKYQAVQSFIEKRMQMPELKDRLHAVWLCLPIPFVGGRVFEAGDEAILKTSIPGLPVIAVFTKYDNLVDTKLTELRRKMPELSIAERKAKAEALAQQAFEESCVKRLPATTGDCQFPHGKVSIYNPTSMEALVKLTSDCVGGITHNVSDQDEQVTERTTNNVSQAVQLSWDVAQRANMQLNIDASIRVGKKRYWRGLASSIDFPNRCLKDCLAVIHTDIVRVWNFNDEHKWLYGKAFRATISQIVDDLADENETSRRRFMAGAGAVGAVAGVISGVFPPAAPATLPIAAVAFFAKWMLDSYNKTPHVLRCMIGYIVDMTLILESLFWLLRTQEGGISTSVTDGHLETASEAYRQSKMKNQIHHKIQVFVEGMKFGDKMDRDVPLDHITQLLEEFRFDPDHHKQNVPTSP